MVRLWSPYDRDPVLVRRNPNASIPLDVPDMGPETNILIMPDGQIVLGDAVTATGEPIKTSSDPVKLVNDAVAKLGEGGDTVAVISGALIGLVLGGNRLLGAIAGGVIGHYGMKIFREAKQ